MASATNNNSSSNVQPTPEQNDINNLKFYTDEIWDFVQPKLSSDSNNKDKLTITDYFRNMFATLRSMQDRYERAAQQVTTPVTQRAAQQVTRPTTLVTQLRECRHGIVCRNQNDSVHCAKFAHNSTAPKTNNDNANISTNTSALQQEMQALRIEMRQALRSNQQPPPVPQYLPQAQMPYPPAYHYPPYAAQPYPIYGGSPPVRH